MAKKTAPARKFKFPDAIERRRVKVEAEAPKSYTQVTVYFAPPLMSAVKDFQGAHYMQTVAEAVRRLVVDGLQQAASEGKGAT